MYKPARSAITLLSILALLLSPTYSITARAEPVDASTQLPQIDCSTARIPITTAIYELFTNTHHMTGPEPMCSKTHGAWLNLADGAADILFLVAPTEDEFKYLAQRGVDIEMKVYGYDGLVFLGNAVNPVNNLSADMIRRIYSGEVTNWRDVAWGDAKWDWDDADLDNDDWDEVAMNVDAEIVVYIRNAESGSQRLFESLVWEGYDMPDFGALDFVEGEINPTVTQREREIEIAQGMESITKNVLANQYAIGFNIMSYIDSEFLNAPGDSQHAFQKLVTTGSANMRTGPGLDYVDINTVPSGTVLDYMGISAVDERGVPWHQVRYDTEYDQDWIAWVSSRYTILSDAAPADLKLFSVNGFAPTTENFASGDYPFVTTSYVAIRADEPADSPARRLYDWVGTDESRALIAANSTLSVSFGDSVVLRTGGRDPSTNAGLKRAIERLDREMLTRTALYEFTPEEIDYLREGVYALSGKAFSEEGYGAYFGAQPWYAPVGGTDEEIIARFNEYQRANLALIQGYEQELLRANANRH